MKKTSIGIAAIAAVAVSSAASAGYNYYDSFGWEDGTSTILGSYGNLGAANNVFDPAGGGQGNVLELFEDPIGGTPQAFVSHITGLQDGDSIAAGFMALGAGDFMNTSSIRIWAHYSDGDISGYEGSAGGNSTYSTGEWMELTDEWTFDSDGGTNSSLIIEARIYTGSGDSGYGYVDDAWVGVNADHDGVDILMANEVPAPGAIALLGLAGLAGRRRRRG
jgi:MYXO-CTERM domain-containing protein